ncbi:p21-C-terminal region-binding protein-domain-containing protein [Mycena albidolilacea]|uniref:Protein BCP1 n=1 Tax=Mycena albidolilacea TaxID=1033008 RepID=A0AAD7ACZ0_9AGAR|nr:p21-C-terminal region-binding protein-domain-containing protein [Mycena albidolilacea]
MSKRKQSPSKEAESDSDSDSVSFVDVSFDFFDPNPTIDYHAIKRLLKQLFQRDADAFDLGALTDLVLSQPTVGTTIKTDGLESDPYALLTVLNMHVHQAHPTIAALAAYFLDKTAQADPAFNATLAGLFRGQGTHVGLVLCERLVNMPVQTVPPMYRMLSDEIKWALADSEPYAFTHLLFVSRAYHLSDAEEEALANRAPAGKSSKKSKKQKGPQPPSQARPQDGIYSFHPEDACIEEHALHSLSYPFSASPEPREPDAFGLDVRGRLMLVDASRWEELVAKMAEVYV